MTGVVAGSGSDAGARAAARVAVGADLLAIGLAVAAAAWRPPPDASDGPLGLLSGVLRMTVGVPFAVVGSLLCARRPRNRVGWLLLAGGLAATIHDFAGVYSIAAQPLPARPFVALVENSGVLLALTALMLLVLVYPDGRLASMWWRPIAWATTAWCALGIVLVILSPEVKGMDNPLGLGGAPGAALRRFPPTRSAPRCWSSCCSHRWPRWSCGSDAPAEWNSSSSSGWSSRPAWRGPPPWLCPCGG